MVEIVRRDFLNGMAVAVLGAGAGCSRPSLGEADEPAQRTGLRGSSPGSFEAAHAVRDGKRYDLDTVPVTERYDLVVVGGGISGLAAAYFHHRKRPGDRILILDNNDDFGGHARRNEFDVDGRKLIGYGGTQSIDSPRQYSAVASGLLRELGIQVDRFNFAYDRKFHERMGLRSATFFGKERYGADSLVLGPPLSAFGEEDPEIAAPDPHSMQSVIARYPISDAGRALVLEIETSDRDPLAGKSDEEKRRIMEKTSYAEFLRQYWGATPEVLGIYRQRLLAFWAANLQGVSAASAFATGLPGGRGLWSAGEAETGDHEPYIYHFPDGNASIARLLVRQMIPGAAAGNTMEDIVTAPFDYASLDRPNAPVRIRLSATAVRVRNVHDRAEAGYIHNKKLHRIQARSIILACYNMMIPFILDELPEEQAAALSMNVKAPLVYVNVAQRNFRAWAKLGIYSIASPAGKMASMSLDFPVSMGSYAFAKTPDDPIVSHHLFVPLDDGTDADMRTQYRAARQVIYDMTFDQFEAALREQMMSALGPAGFDFDRDVAAITVNRWPHGYAYTPDTLHDDPAEQGARKLLARRPLGRVAIANSDAGWDAYSNVAIDEAWRAVNELWAKA